MGNEDEGIFGKKNKGGQGAIVKSVQQDNAALALAHKQVGKLALAVASGATVTADAQRVLLFLASYGDGDRMGKFVFSSGELVGLPKTKKIVGSGDPGQGGADYVDVPASPPTDDGKALGLSGVRLNDAVSLLVGRGWAKTTDDEEYGIDCDFASVSLTEAGRTAAQGAVKKAGLKAGASFESFEGLPGLFDEAGPSGGAAAATDREQLGAMLARARIDYGVGHSGEGVEGRSTIVIDHGRAPNGAFVEFSFDESGALKGVGFPKATASEKPFVVG